MYLQRCRRSRLRAADARWRAGQLAAEKQRDEVLRQVCEGWNRVQSMTDQIAITRQGLVAAEEAYSLALARKEFGVGVVLETIQAEQELTRLRGDLVRAVGDFNRAQCLVWRSVGGLGQHEGPLPKGSAQHPNAPPPPAPPAKTVR